MRPGIGKEHFVTKALEHKRTANRSEELWVSFVNSPQFRRFTSTKLGAALFEGRTAQRLHMARRYLSTYYQVRKNPQQFRDVKCCCIFIGHTKSGSSMMGAMLDAHPNIILADGSDALQYVPAGFSKEQLFHILVKCSHREAMKGRVTARRLSPYSFEVPNQWQGRYETLQVVGDTTSETALRRMANDPTLLVGLQKMMKGVEVKFVHVIRNPFDPISAMRIRGKRTAENAIERYFSICEMLVETRKQLDESNLLALRYEDAVYQPQQKLAELCQYLGVTAGAHYLQASTSILHKTPERTRDRVPWTAAEIATVEKKIAMYDFLKGYSFEN